jgi:hypothetical protein
MRITFIIAAFLLIKPSWAQQKVSFGKVSMQELEMKFYEKDTAASAVILSDIGVFDSRDLKFTRHVRIKILTKPGLEWGNWVINTPSKGDFNLLVFNLENGEIQKEKIASSSIYSEEIVAGFSVYKVFAPNVKVGSVIDLKYSFLGLPFEWRFQERIPIVYNELRVDDSEFIKYSKTFFGLAPIETLSLNNWRARHMPAIKVEPFINTYTNYISKFEFQIISFSIPGTLIYQAFSTSWRNVVNNLLDYTNFGGVLSGSAFLNDAANRIKRNDSLTVEQKIQHAFQYVQKNIKWNGNKTVMASRNFKWNFSDDHVGNNADVNLSLICLLNKIGINTYPIVLSTRDNGLLQEASPTLDKLNYVVAMVQHDNIQLFLDATSEFIGVGFLPEYCLNIRGLLVKRDNEQWFTLQKKNFLDSKKQFVNISFIGETATAKITQDFSGVAFTRWINDLKNGQFDAENRMNELAKLLPNTRVSGYQIGRRDVSECTGKESFEVDFTNQIVDDGQGYLISPLFFFDYVVNPFKLDERKLPVDLISEKELTSTVLFNAPKGFSIKKSPESVKLSTPDGSASFSFLVGGSTSGLQYRVSLKISRSVFSETEYLELKQFFTQIGKVISTPIELMKS